MFYKYSGMSLRIFICKLAYYEIFQVWVAGLHTGPQYGFVISEISTDKPGKSARTVDKNFTASLFLKGKDVLVFLKCR